MIFRVIVIVGIFLLSACVSVPPMKSSLISDLKQGKSAVDFYDGAKEIAYIEDVYLVLAVTQEASKSVYGDLWDNSKELSALHSKELSKLGVRAQSVHDSLSGEEISEFNAMQKKMYGRYKSGPERKTFNLSAEYRSLLLKKGYDYLFWITGPEYLLHMHALGLPAFSTITTTYWIYDLKKNTTIWSGSIKSLEKIELGERTGKEFIEKNNLSGLKDQVIRLTRERYDISSGKNNYTESTGQLLGLEPANKEAY